MTRRAIFPLVISSFMAAGLAGCQSASRWAWWKNQDDSASSVAQASAPALPSEGATPQAVDVPGLEPASSPSAANLAAAQSITGSPSVSLPTSSASTIANAPLANYPPAGTAATAGSSTSASLSQSETTGASAIASVPPSGPYDPYGYKGNSSYSAAATTAYEPPASNPLRNSETTADPYAMPVENTTHAVDPQYAAATSPAAETTTPTIDKYALPPMAAQSSATTNPMSTPAAYPSPSSAEAAFANAPTPGSSQTASAAATSASSATSAIDVTPVTTATVQLPQAGKYRPGGTSDYAIAAESQPIEVAALPAAPQAAPASARASDPWAPPAATTPVTGGGIGTY
jgi:hypothetical protein